MTSIDDEASMSTSLITPDAHGAAALLLVESLIHGLIAQSLLSRAQAVGIIDIAAEASDEIADYYGGGPTVPQPSLLLGYISNDLRRELEE